MAKKRRRGKGRGRITDLDRAKARFWSDRIQAGLTVREDYDRIAKDVQAHLRTDKTDFFDSEAVRHHYMDFRGASIVTVPKLAQTRNSLLPRLVPAKPARSVTPSGRDPVVFAMAKVLEAYLNYSARECKYVKQIRKSVNDAIIRGRGYLTVAWDEVRELVTSRYVSSLDVVFDPDVVDIDDARWIAIRKVEALYETKRRLSKGERWRIKNLKSRKTFEDQDERENQTDDRYKPSTNELVEYWVVLSKMGSGQRGADFEAPGSRESRNDDPSQDFKRLEIVIDHECPLFEGEWSIPLYLDREWPISYVDYLEPLDEPYPLSMGGQILPNQRAVDLLSSLRLTSCKNRDRLVTLVDSQLDIRNQDQIRNGTSADFIQVELPSGKTMQDVVHTLDWGQGTPESAAEREFHLQQIEATTGVTSMLHGGHEEDAKDRSATATNVRSEASQSRVQDLRHLTEIFESDAARKEAIVARLTLDPEEVSRVVKDAELEGFFWIRVEVPGEGVIPVRDFDEKTLSLADISPGAGTYFMDLEAAYEGAIRLWQDMQMSPDPKVIELMESIMVKGIAEEDGLPVAMKIAPVTVDRVWEDTSDMSAVDLMRELSYTLHTGSGIKIDKQQERAAADEAMQTVLPIALQTGDFNAANKILADKDEAYEKPPEQRIELAPPMPQGAM